MLETLSFALAVAALAYHAHASFRPMLPLQPAAVKPARRKPVKVSAYPADWDEVEAEVKAEVRETNKKRARAFMAEHPDTSADAVGEHFGIGAHAARALAKGTGNRGKRSHKGNDYEVRNA